MQIFRKADISKIGSGVAWSAIAGVGPLNLVHKAADCVLAEGGADRAGVWLEANDSATDDSPFLTFTGVVRDKQREATPAEWKSFSPDASLLRELLRGKAVESDCEGSPERVTIGALIDMRRALWVPVLTQGILRGVILAAVRRRHAALRTAAVQRIASELAMALALEGERRLAQDRLHEVNYVRRMLAVCASVPALALQNLAESCTEKEVNGSGPGATFAAIAEINDLVAGETLATGPSGEPKADPHETKASLAFSWRSGDSRLTTALENEPMAAVWRQAVESQRVTGSESSAGEFEGVSRLVAFPLHDAGKMLGVLVAGLPPKNASLANFERLELRANLATVALVKLRQSRDGDRQDSSHQAILAGSNEVIVLVDALGKVVGRSHKARDLLKEENKGDQGNSLVSENLQSLADLFHVREQRRMEDWLRMQSTDDASQAGREPIQAELANGTVVRVRAVRSGTSSSGGAAVFLEALQPRKVDAGALRAETELRNAIEWLEEGIVLFDARQKIRAMNSRFAQMAGLAPEDAVRTHTLNDLIGRLATQTADPDNFAKRWRALAHGTDSGIRDELQLLRPAPRVLERVARPVLDAAGGRLGRVEIYRDLTAQREFHSKLIQTEKLAALGQMVTGIAHELSNPLTTILGYAQRLLVKSEILGQSTEARQIFQEAERASVILRQLLLTARGARPEHSKVPLNEVVLRTIELQKTALTSEKIVLELDLGPMLPAVIGDAGQLQQVLMNLLGNARQAIEQRGTGGTIRIRTKHAAKGPVVLEVSDDGPGIPEAILTKIFDPFFSTKPAGIGTGLGLSIVLGIVREHGGQVRVGNNPSGGATFSIELPSQGAVTDLRKWTPAPSLRDQPAEVNESALAPWTGATVLVVEDEATVARLIADVLEDEGLRVDVLLDGREALRRVTAENYELVVCDMKMPGLGGEQFFKALLRMNRSARPPVLFVTGDVLAGRTREFLERHTLPHLAKPFRVEELTEKVRQVLAETSLRESRIERSNVARN